jgi:hypothetical protein
MILELRLSFPQALRPKRRPRHLWANPIGIYNRTMNDPLSNIFPPHSIAVPTCTSRAKIAAQWTPNLTILREKIYSVRV